MWTMVSKRVASIHARVTSSEAIRDKGAADLRRRSLARTAGEPPVIREARAIAYYLQNRALVIHDDELIVGSSAHTETAPAKLPLEATPPPARYVPESLPPNLARFFERGMLGYAGNHTTIDYETILSTGYRGLIGRIDRRLAKLSSQEPGYAEKQDFLRALRIVAEAVIAFSDRYGEHATALARKERDPQRRRELECIARNCHAVPADRPSSFWEACQSLWFSFFIMPDSPGRPDQYLYPFYRRDIESGRITREFALELIECLWLKYFELCGSNDPVSARHHLVLGGVKRDGSDASNEVTYLCLDATEQLKLFRPQVSLRWHRGTPPELLKRAVCSLRSRTGHPGFCNDERIVRALANIGIEIEDARNYTLSGCHEVIITGKAQMGAVEGFINLPKILEIVLGLEPCLRDGVDLDKIDSFEKLWEALVDAMAFVVSNVQDLSELLDRLRAEWPGGHLMASLVTQDCIEKAYGYTQGGAHYNFCNWDAIGLANLADSLIAIKKLVFEERELTLQRFVAILRGNWDGAEPLRRRVLNQLPHFGNDEDEVDALAAEIIRSFVRLLKSRRPFRGGEYNLGTLAGGENMHIVFGRQTGATPDGRRAGEPLADSLAAAQGRDRRGITAMLNSVAKMPHDLLPTSTTVNVKLDPKLLDDEDGIEKIAALIQSHFVSGGQQVQFNFVNRHMLEEAKRCPELHAGLMVRVAGYSAAFVTLWPDLQDEIISRTEHSL